MLVFKKDHRWAEAAIARTGSRVVETARRKPLVPGMDSRVRIFKGKYQGNEGVVFGVTKDAKRKFYVRLDNGRKVLVRESSLEAIHPPKE